MEWTDKELANFSKTSMSKSENKKATITICNFESAKDKSNEKSSVTNQASKQLQKTNSTGTVNMNSNNKPSSLEEVITVQYNPSSISINASMHGADKKRNMIKEGEITKTGGISSFSLKVELIFASETEGDITVLAKINQFVLFLSTSKDRLVIFSWGTTFFKGVVTGMDVNYSQFEYSGNPTYATVSLSLDGIPAITKNAIDVIGEERDERLYI